MSYILDALRKAEEERSLGQIPEAKTVYEFLPVRRQRSWAQTLLGLLLLLNGAALSAFFLLTEYGDGLLSGNSTKSTVSRTTPVEPASSTPPASLAQNQFEDHTTGIEKSPPSAKTEKKITLPVPTSSPTSAATVTPVEAAQLPNETVAPTTPSWINPQHPVPYLNLDIHVYDQTQQKSFVVINSVRYQEGEQLKEGPNLELITQDGAILSYAGQRFRLSVGGSRQ